MGSPTKKELKLLYKYAKDSNFAVETGSGTSTKWIQAATKGNGRFISIDLDAKNQFVLGVEYWLGWSVSYEDVIKFGHPKFFQSRHKTIDGLVATDGPKHMKGRTNLLREVLQLGKLDFFFCDTGEYCGWAEWEIVKNEIIPGGKIICHDIYYPKSIKCFQTVRDIEQNPKWKVIKKTSSKQGMMIAQRLS